MNLLEYCANKIGKITEDNIENVQHYWNAQFRAIATYRNNPGREQDRRRIKARVSQAAAQRTLEALMDREERYLELIRRL